MAMYLIRCSHVRQVGLYVHGRSKGGVRCEVDYLLGGRVPYQLHHLGISLPTRRAAERAQRTLGVDAEWVNELAQHDCVCYFCPAPGPALEFVVPLHAGSSTNKLPGGVHHFGLLVRNLDEAWCTLEEDGYQFIDAAPLEVVGRYRIGFLDPMRFGFLVELVEDKLVE